MKFRQSAYRLRWRGIYSVHEIIGTICGLYARHADRRCCFAVNGAF